MKYQATVAIAVAVALLVIGVILIIIPYYDSYSGSYNPVLFFFYSEIILVLAISMIIAGVGLGIGGAVLAILNKGKSGNGIDRFEATHRKAMPSRLTGVGKIVGGVILIILGIVAYGVTVYANNLAGQGVQQCSSFLGQLGQTFSSDISQQCSVANIVVAAGGAGIIVAIIFVIIGISLTILGSISRLKLENKYIKG